MSAPVIRRSELGELRKLGQGGFARVFLAPNYRLPGLTGPVVYKQYFDRVVEKHPGLLYGLQAIVTHLERLDAKPQAMIADRTVWPLAVVVDDDDLSRAVGMLMRLIPQEFFISINQLKGPSDEPAEAKYLFCDGADTRRMGILEPNFPTRIAILRQVAYAFGLLHKSKVVVGDISPRNVLYSARPGEAPSVLVVDCDSLRVSGSASPFGAQPHTPYWEPPEAVIAKRRLKSASKGGQALSDSKKADLHNETRVQSTETDVYKFGLLVIRTLDYGRGKSGHRDLAVARRHLQKVAGQRGIDVLEATFSTKPADRPTMKDWYDVLGGRASGAPPPPPQRLNDRAKPTRPKPLKPPPPKPERPPSPTTKPASGARKVSGSFELVPGVGWVKIKGT